MFIHTLYINTKAFFLLDQTVFTAIMVELSRIELLTS